MKVPSFFLMAALAVAPALAQTDSGAKQDMKTAGHDTSAATKSAGHGIAKGTKKGYHKTVNGTKKGAKETGHVTKEGVDKTGHATENLGKKIEGKPTN